MKLHYATLAGLFGAVGITAATQAASIEVDGLGGSITMNSGAISGVFGSGGGSHEFDNDELTTFHNTLHGDGISTDNMVTFLLADTTAGLSFVVLFDDITQTLSGSDITRIGMSSTSPSHTGFEINDIGLDPWTESDPFGVDRTVSAEMSWLTARGADGFATTGLLEGDGGTFNFTDMEGDAFAGDSPFQFVSWDAATGKWMQVAQGDWSGDGQFAFSFAVVPLPAPILLGLAGLAGVAVMRRRRTA